MEREGGSSISPSNDSNEAMDLRIHKAQSSSTSSSSCTRSRRPTPNTTISSREHKNRKKHVNIFKKHKLKYRYLLNRHLKNSSDSGQFGSSSMIGSSSTGSSSITGSSSNSNGKRSTQGDTTTSPPCTSTSPSSGSGTSNSPQTFAPHMDMQSSGDQQMCMMLGHAVPLVVMMQGQLQSTSNVSSDISYSNTMLFKCNMCSMFSNNLTDVLSHVNSNHANIHYCFVCNQFHANKREYDRHKDVCASARQAFQQIIDGHYHGNRPPNSSHGGSRDQALNLSVAGDVARRAAQIVHNKKSRRKKLKKLLKCTYCKKAFFGRFYLQRHLRSHTGEKACYCDICGKGFAEWRNLRNHVSRFHNGSESASSRGRQSKSDSVSPNGTSDSYEPNPRSRTSQTLSNANAARYQQLQSQSISEQPRRQSVTITEPHVVDAVGNIDNTTSLVSQQTHCSFKPVKNTANDVERSVTHPNGEGVRHEVHMPQASMNWTAYSAAYNYSSSSSSYMPSCPSSLSMSSSCSSTYAVSDYSSSADLATNTAPTYSSATTSDITTSTYTNGQKNDSLDSRGVSESSDKTADSMDVKPGTMYLGSTSSRLQLSTATEEYERSLHPISDVKGKKTYKCQLCDKQFQTKFAVQRHLDFHADKRPFECTQCDYKAKTRPQLKVHVLRHSGKKGFHCSICNYSCVTHSDLNRHCKSRSHLFRVGVMEQKGEQQPSQSNVKDDNEQATSTSQPQ